MQFLPAGRFPAAIFAACMCFSVALPASADDHPEMKAPEYSPKAGQDENRLIHESSPYLLQHAHNPVDWYPWGEEAFARARKEDKPIFLSIGYSTCHWCHVMEAEVFSDPEAAALINRVFVAIKVDREERPDIDQVYMAVAQILNGHGGWPLNIFMTADKKPFYAASYIPKNSRFGHQGVMELLPRIEDLWTRDREQIIRSAASITSALSRAGNASARGKLKPAILDATYRQLARGFDAEHGGFGDRQKFPRPHNLRYLLRYWKRTGDRQALDMVERTLDAMRRGGIYDQVGYGFHRYSTDRAWQLPHFEKMLYDQALIAMAYVEAYAVTGRLAYAATAREIFAYVLRDMRAPEGGFYSAEDADSEGEEGLFYLWTEAEIRRLLDKRTTGLFLSVYNFRPDGNFAEEAGGGKTGRNILYRSKSWQARAAQLGLSENELRSTMQTARARLFDERGHRIRPYLDDKVLTDWNGLMIASLAMGGRILNNPAYVQAADKAADFILQHMRDKDGSLLHRYRAGQAGIAAKLDDYAFLVWGLLELYEAGFGPDRLSAALQLNRIMLRDFWDEKSGGLFLTAQGAENLLIRPKEAYDGAVPSGNSVALLNTLRLARMTASADMEKQAQGIGEAFIGQVQQAPSGYTQFMLGVDFALSEGHEAVITGDPDAKDTQAMLQSIQQRFLPHTVTLFRASTPNGDAMSELAPFTRSQTAIDGRATAYICRNFACNEPTTNIGRMLELLGAEAEKRRQHSR